MQNYPITTWIFTAFIFFHFQNLQAKINPQNMCQPFRIHLHAENPSPPPQLSLADFQQSSVDELLLKIAAVPYHADFPRLFQKAHEEKRMVLSENQTKPYLHCIYHYISQDTDKDGIPDWSAITNQLPSNILIPLDPDINGNGIRNIFDPSPLIHHQPREVLSSREIPLHLKMSPDKTITNDHKKDDEVQLNRAAIQAKLWYNFGIIAVDHTDKHARVVLQELLTLLENSLYYFQINELHSNYEHRYDSALILYAFKGHDPKWNIAAYHQEIRAISIGGINSYNKEVLDSQNKVHLIASLAHELGHDFIFSHLNAQKLGEVGEKLGGWTIPSKEDIQGMTLYDPIFLLPYQQNEPSSADSTHEPNLIRTFSFASQYAFTNIHEWFADAFAGWILQKLGQKGLLGENWQPDLIKDPIETKSYWVNYQNVSGPFVEWMDHKVASLNSK